MSASPPSRARTFCRRAMPCSGNNPGVGPFDRSVHFEILGNPSGLGLVGRVCSGHAQGEEVDKDSYPRDAVVSE